MNSVPRSKITRLFAWAAAIGLASLTTSALAWSWTNSEQYGKWTDSEGWLLENDVWGPSGGWQQTIYADSHSYFQVTGNLKAQQYIASYPHASKDIGRPVSDVANAAKPLMVTVDATIPTDVDFGQATRSNWPPRASRPYTAVIDRGPQSIFLNTAVGFTEVNESARRRSVLARDMRSESRASTLLRMNGYASVIFLVPFVSLCKLLFIGLGTGRFWHTNMWKWFLMKA